MILIKNATIVDSKSPFNGKNVDILIEKGKIKSIKKNIKPEKKHQVITHKNLHVSPGWMDMRANFRDPGFEYKEHIETGIKAARKGGFTEVVLTPETEPCIDSKADIEYIINKAKNFGIRIYPMGTISKGMQGKSLAEMYDMKQAGAVGFSDSKKPISADLMMKALYYVKNFDGLILRHASNASTNGDGIMHEGENSTRLGMNGMPALSEDLEVTRDLELLEYTESKLHLSLVTSRKALDKIKAAKKSKLHVTADISPLYLYFTDDVLKEYDTNFKLYPPLRTADHQKAIIKALKEGTIDVICSDHEPEDTENKRLEFEYAAFGAAGIETLFATTWTALHKHLKLEQVIDKITHNPRNILQLEDFSIQENSAANLTLFNPDETWTPQQDDFESLGVNQPMIGEKLRGVVYEVVC